MLLAGKKYQAKYVVLETRNPSQLKPVYDHPGEISGLKYLGDVESTRIFEILD
jgi:hypothetical protein